MLKSSAVVSYTRSSRHERTTTYERSSSSRYVDHESKHRSRRSPDREYGRDLEDGDEYYAHSSSKSRYHTDQHSYHSSTSHHSHHANHHNVHRSDPCRDRERHHRSPSDSRKRSYRDDEYCRPVDRHSGLEHDDHRVRAVESNSYYSKSSSSAGEKLASSSHRSSGRSDRIHSDESRSGNHVHSAPTTASSPVSLRYTSSKRSSVIRTYGDWEEHVSSNHKLYYYNRVTGVSQWEKPRDVVRVSSHSHADLTDAHRSKSPAPPRHRNHVPGAPDSDEEDVYDRKRNRRSTAVTKEEIPVKSQSSHVSHHHNNHNNVVHSDHRSSRSAHQQSDCHSRSHSLLDRSSSVQSSPSHSSHSPPDEEDRRRVRSGRSTNFRDSIPSESSRSLKRKNADITSDRREPAPHSGHAVVAENGVSRRPLGREECNGVSSQRKKVLVESPLLPHHSDLVIRKKEEFVATSSDHNSNSSCRSQCLSPSQVTMDNLEKIIDSLADTPGLPDLRKLSREDALKTIQQVLRIMKEASLGLASSTPSRVSPGTGSSSVRSGQPGFRSRSAIVRNASATQVVDREPAINGGAVFLNRQDLTIPSPSSEISGYSSTRSPSDSGVDIAVPSKPCVPSLTATLENFFREDLIRHVQNWTADHAERQVRCPKIPDSFNRLTCCYSYRCTDRQTNWQKKLTIWAAGTAHVSPPS